MNEECVHGEERFVIEPASPEATIRIRTGKAVFLERQRDPSDLGRIVDFFNGCRYIGFIDQSFEDGGLCDVFVAPTNHLQEEPIPLTTGCVSLDEAIRILRESATQ